MRFNKTILHILLILFTSLLFQNASCGNQVLEEKKFNFTEEVNKFSTDYDTTRKLKINFITNRKLSSENPGCSDKYYTVSYDPNPRFGICEVNVPMLHDIGNIDMNPSKPDDQTFKFQGHTNTNPNQFLDAIQNNPHPEVIVFVHGFNVKFEEAVLRAAQIKYDLKFPGEIILMTWPAGSEEGFFNTARIDETYKKNRENAEKTIPVFKSQLNTILLLPKKVHVIVHSMGHQIMIPILHELYKNYNKKIFGEIVFNAPDFESTKFGYMSSDLQKSADRITVYCSPGDTALVASSKLNSTPRIGSCEKIPGIDMINVNAIDDPILGLGHGYYSSRPILSDLYQVILGVKASRRLFLRKSTQRTEDYIMRK
jgi:esterase/lipase superfamily enzyme